MSGGPLIPSPISLALAIACAGCAWDQGASASLGAVSLSVVPLVEGGIIVRAVFDLRIDMVDADGRASPHLAVSDLTTGPGGALTYVGTCRSGPGGEPGLGVATATLKSLELADGVETFGAQLPMIQVRAFRCYQGGDTPIDFTFDVVLQLERGFTDVRVSLEHVECAAKFDCQQNLLPQADGTHGPTLVTGLSCRGGSQTPTDHLLSFTRQVRCFDGAGHLLSPALAPVFLESRTYTGFEQAPAWGGTGEAYWNTATLVDVAALASIDHCRVEALGLVRTQPVGPARQGWARVGTAAIRWDVELRAAAGALVCEGAIGPDKVGLRIDDAPSPADSTVSPASAPVRQRTTAIVSDLRDPGCLAREDLWAAALGELEAAQTRLASYERLLADEAALAGMLALLGDPSAPGADTFAAALAQARTAHAQVDFDQAQVDALLTAAQALLSAAGASLASIDAAEPLDVAPLHDGLDAVGDGLGAAREDARMGRFFVTTYVSIEAAAAALTTEARAGLDAARATRDALGEADALAAAVDLAAARVERTNADYTQCLLLDPGPKPALRLWRSGDVVFPQPAFGTTHAPVQDELLWVATRLGTPYEVSFESACVPQPSRATIVVRLRDSAEDPQGHRAALVLIRSADDNWRCLREPDGSCTAFELAEVDCTPEVP